MTTVRCFVALDPAPSTRDWLAAWLVEAAAAVPWVRWSQPGNLHLTLLFYAALDLRHVPDLVAAMGEVALPGGGLALDWRPGAFEGRGRGSDVVFLPAALDARPVLGRLNGDLMAAVQRRGLATERRAFQPHLTLGRLRRPGEHFDPAPLFRKFPTGQLALAGDRLVLYRSHLSSGPPRYEPLAETQGAG